MPEKSVQRVSLRHGRRLVVWRLKVGDNLRRLASPEAGTHSIERIVFEGDGVKPFLSIRGKPDWTDPATLAASLLEGAVSDRDKAFRLYRFMLGANANLSMQNRTDVTLYLHSLGSGYCATQARLFQCLLEIAGVPWRMPDTPGHATTEVFYDDLWHNLDPYVRAYFLKRDGETAASCAELMADPGLLLRHADADGLFPKLMAPPGQIGERFWFHYTGNSSKPLIPWSPETFRLRRGERLTLCQKPLGQWRHAVSEPPDYANGLFEATVGPFPPDWSAAFESVENLALDPARGVLSPESPDRPAAAVYRLRFPYLLATGTLTLRVTGAGSGPGVEAAVQSPLTGNGWEPLPLKTTGRRSPLRADLTPFMSRWIVPEVDPTPEANMRFDYRVRLSWPPVQNPPSKPPGLAGLHIRHVFQYFPPSVPDSVAPGEELRVNGCKGTGRVTLMLRSQAGLRVSDDEPFENDPVTLTARVDNPGSQPAQGVVVTFYDGDPETGGVPISQPVPLPEIAPGETAEATTLWSAWIRADRPSYGWHPNYLKNTVQQFAALTGTTPPPVPGGTTLLPPRTYKATWLYARIQSTDPLVRIRNRQTRIRVKVRPCPCLVITPEFIVVTPTDTMDGKLITITATARYLPDSNLFIYQQPGQVSRLPVRASLLRADDSAPALAVQETTLPPVRVAEHATLHFNFTIPPVPPGEYRVRVELIPGSNHKLGRSRLVAEQRFRL